MCISKYVHVSATVRTGASANAVTDADVNTGAEASGVANEDVAEASEQTSKSCVETLKGSETSLSDSTPLAIAQRAKMRALGEVTPRTKMRREAATASCSEHNARQCVVG